MQQNVFQEYYTKRLDHYFNGVLTVGADGKVFHATRTVLLNNNGKIRTYQYDMDRQQEEAICQQLLQMGYTGFKGSVAKPSSEMYFSMYLMEVRDSNWQPVAINVNENSANPEWKVFSVPVKITRLIRAQQSIYGHLQDTQNNWLNGRKITLIKLKNLVYSSPMGYGDVFTQLHADTVDLNSVQIPPLPQQTGDWITQRLPKVSSLFNQSQPQQQQYQQSGQQVYQQQPQVQQQQKTYYGVTQNPNSGDPMF